MATGQRSSSPEGMDEQLRQRLLTIYQNAQMEERQREADRQRAIETQAELEAEEAEEWRKRVEAEANDHTPDTMTPQEAEDFMKIMERYFKEDEEDRIREMAELKASQDKGEAEPASEDKTASS